MKNKKVLFIGFIILFIVSVLILGLHVNDNNVDLDVIKNKLININGVSLRDMQREEVMTYFGLESELMPDSLFMIDSVDEDILSANIVIIVCNYDDITYDAINSFIVLNEDLTNVSIVTKNNNLLYVSGNDANDIKDIIGLFND